MFIIPLQLLETVNMYDTIPASIIDAIQILLANWYYVEISYEVYFPFFAYIRPKIIYAIHEFLPAGWQGVM